MGIIDVHHYKLTCDTCNHIEEGKVVDKGSSFGGSSWSNRTSFKNFECEWEDTKEPQEPELLKAVCKTCGKPATVKSWYSI